MYLLRRRDLQNRDGLGRVHKLRGRHVLANRSRHVCRGVHRVPGQRHLSSGKHRGRELRVQRRVRVL